MEIVVNTDHSAPLVAQVVGQIREAVRRRGVRPGDRLPSARQLANDLGLSSETIAEAYDVLERDSVIEAGPGSAVVRRDAAARLDLEDDNARKTRELEEARDLQSSLLPGELPDCPGFEVAAAMVTASEVGGDYYDFEVDDGGGLTVVLGDAVGHGARAGALVAATKGIFSAGVPGLGAGARLEGFDAAFRRMRMRRASVALILAVFRGSLLEVASAGMPRPLLHRASSGRVEEIPVAGTPLGSKLIAGRRAREAALEEGDTLLLMSDGLPEMVLESGEPLGYEGARAAFAQVCALPVDRIVRSLQAVVERTANGRPADDVTLVAVRRRATSR